MGLSFGPYMPVWGQQKNSTQYIVVLTTYFMLYVLGLPSSFKIAFDKNFNLISPAGEHWQGRQIMSPVCRDCQSCCAVQTQLFILDALVSVCAFGVFGGWGCPLAERERMLKFHF